MNEGDFFKKALQVGTAAAISAAPVSTTQAPELSERQQQAIVKEITVEKPIEKELDPSTTANFEEYENSKQNAAPQSPTEILLDDLRDIASEKIKAEAETFLKSAGETNNTRKQHDHELLALGTDASFNADLYTKMMNEKGDSLYYKQSPKRTFDYFAKEDGITLPTEKNKIKAREKFNELIVGDDYFKDMTFEKFCNEYMHFPDEKKLADVTARYEKYKSNIHPQVKESHVGSTAYAILRTGLYDAWKKEGGEKAKLADNIIGEINESYHYVCDSTTNADNPVLQGNYLTRANEVEWIMSTWLELAKRGESPVFDRGGEHGSPFTLAELNSMVEKRLAFTLDTTNIEEKKKRNPSRDPWIKEEGNAACEGTHSLHSLVMYDVFTKDTVKLGEHLKLAGEKLTETMTKADTATAEKDKIEAVHDLSHWLLPFTELGGEVAYSEDIKKIAKDAAEKMLVLTKELKGKLDVPNLAHTIDTFDHLPENLRP